MELHRITLTKSQLAALPPAERSLLLLLGHASNEINVLSKLILMVRKDAPPSRIAEKVEAGQACVLLRVLVGQLHEAWELFRKRVQADRPLHDKYVPLLDTHGVTALDNLNRYFGRESPLAKIRNAPPPRARPGEWHDDDYDVLADGVIVGRIMKAAAVPLGMSWMWTVAFGHHENRMPTHGAALAKSWRARIRLKQAKIDSL